MKSPSVRHQVLAGYIRRTRGRSYSSAGALRAKVHKNRRTRSFDPPSSLGHRYTVRRSDFGGWPCFTVRSRCESRRNVLYLHGGGYVFEINKWHWFFIARIAERLQAEVYVPIFPLAPEYTYVDTYPVLTALYRHLRVMSEPLIVMGDSTGGTASLVVTQLAIQEGSAGPDQLILLSPVVDPTLSNPDIPAINVQDPWLSVPGLREGINAWAGGGSLTDPRLNPLKAPFRGIDSAVIVTGTRDITNPDNRVLHRRLIEEGTAVEWVEGTGLIHVFPLLPVPEAKWALDRISDSVA